MLNVNNYYIGIDIAKYTHTVSVMNHQGEIIIKNKSFDNTRDGLTQLYAYIQQYQQSGSIYLGCEATGHYWLNLFHFLVIKGIEISVFNPLQIASFRDTKIRGNKTDSDDSVLIAKVLKFGLSSPCQVPDEQKFELKELTRFRHDLKQQSTAVKLKIMHVLDQVFPEFMTLFKDVNGKAAQVILEQYCDPQTLESISTKDLTRILETASKKRLGKSQATQLKTKAKQSIGLRFGIDVFVFQIKLLLQQIQNIEQQIKLLDERIIELVKNSHTTLTTIPGVSYITAGTILGECNAFKSKGPHSFLAFTGLDPKKKESGLSKGKVKMSKRGSRNLRHSLWLAACSARLHSPTFKKVFETQKDKGKHYNVAISHVAKKMAYIVDYIMRTNDIFKEQIT